VQFLAVVAKPRAGLLGEQGRELAPQHGEADATDRSVRLDLD
jgi:hypothetical protein